MIKEAYVSSEVAVLLKEKGFDEPCEMFYNEHFKSPYRGTLTKNSHTSSYTVPTQQMAMAWLREVHNIDIEVQTHYLNYLKPNDTRYYSGKILKGSEDVIHTIYAKDTYEQACEAAINYCLTHKELLDSLRIN